MPTEDDKLLDCFEEIANAFFKLGNSASELYVAVVSLMQSHLNGAFRPSVVYGNTWRRMHGLKPRRRPLKERQRRKDV